MLSNIEKGKRSIKFLYERDLLQNEFIIKHVSPYFNCSVVLNVLMFAINS